MSIKTLQNDAVPHILKRFRQNAVATGNRLAVSSTYRSFTYAELDEISTDICNWLRSNCFQKGTVAILAARTADLVAALIGVWKASHSVVILDVNYPKDRLHHYIMVTAPVAFINCTGSSYIPGELRELLGTYPVLIELDDVRGLHHTYHQELLDSWSDGTNPFMREASYVSFTSGTTGTPLGVVGTCEPISHFIEWYLATLMPHSRDRFSMLSGLGHDPIFRDIFVPLAAGGCICIPNHQIHILEQLGAWLTLQKISVCHITPSMVTVLASTPHRSDSLRLTCFAGEPLTFKHVQIVHQFSQNAHCINFYGTTETPQAMAFCKVESSEDSDGERSIPIGRPIDGVELFLLQEDLSPTPEGEIGEIYVRTSFLSKGYLQDEAATSTRYIVNPFNSDPADLFYKTGDLARKKADGNIFFVGRSDTQIKVRGFRVEPVEVELVLLSHIDVTAAMVVPIRQDDGTAELRAYAVLREASLIENHDLIQFIKSRLPIHMVPTMLSILPALPLTLNGKIDIAKLDDAVSREVRGTASLTHYEKLLRSIFCDLLPSSTLGLDDDFLSLGLHSLLLQRAANRIQERLHFEVGMRMLFEFPSIRLLAAELDAWLLE